jgi:hypothetical protein
MDASTLIHEMKETLEDIAMIASRRIMVADSSEEDRDAFIRIGNLCLRMFNLHNAVTNAPRKDVPETEQELQAEWADARADGEATSYDQACDERSYGDSHLDDDEEVR